MIQALVDNIALKGVPLIDSSFPLNNIAEAFNRLEERSQFGKISIRIR